MTLPRLLPLFLLLPLLAHPGVPVPERLEFCGMQLTLNAAARTEVQKQVDRLMANGAYYQKLVQRAATYMPYVEDAFRHMGVPEDLKYIVLQESALVGDAVSTSNAVGFWQFKEATAKEVGLWVTPEVDERMHISRASAGAARYFFKCYSYYENWVYAVIAYQTGPTGALPHVKEDYYSTNRMAVDGSLYWYAVKALAHKVAFQQALGKAKPTQWLEACDAGAQLSPEALARQAGMTSPEFFRYNLWMRGNHLPKGRPHTYFKLHQQGGYKHVPDPHLAIFMRPAAQAPLVQRRKSAAPPVAEKRPTPPSPQPKATEPDAPVRLPALSADPAYQVEYTLVGQATTLKDFCKKHGFNLKKLAKWNRLVPSSALGQHQWVLLVPPSRAATHVVQPRESWAQIAERYELTPQQLLQRNYLKATDRPRPGMKLYLRHTAPPGGAVVYALPGQEQTAAPVAAPAPQAPAVQTPTTQPVPVKTEAQPPAQSSPSAQPAQVQPAGAQVPAQPLPGNAAQELHPSALVQPLVTRPPDTAAVVVSAPAATVVQATPVASAVTEYTIHRVAKGETLYSLARQYGLTVPELKTLNDLQADALQVGQLLKVPLRP